MTDPRLTQLGNLTASLKSARAMMAAGQPSLLCVTGVILATYAQADAVQERWKKEDEAAFKALEKALIAEGDEYSIEHYEYIAEMIEETYRANHRVTASDAVEGVLKYTWVQLALCNSTVIDAVAFAALMSMIDFYLEPVDDFPSYIQTVARGVLFASISRPVPAVELAKALEHAYTGQAAAQVITAIERAVLVGLRAGVSGGDKDDPKARWQYFGPEDDRNRKFCGFMVTGTRDGRPRLYTAAMIDGCANGFGTSVWDDCGGPNCRHVMLPVPPGAWSDFDVIGDYHFEAFQIGTSGSIGRYVKPGAA